MSAPGARPLPPDSAQAAEILPCPPRWHVVVVAPGRDAVAADHLVARRFGIYQPMQRLLVRRRGRTCWRRVPLLPGYIFAFVWDLGAHARRILACPGVVGILASDASRAAALEQAIAALQARELGREIAFALRRRRRRRAHGEDEVVAVRTYSALAAAADAPAAHVDLLRRVVAIHSGGSAGL